MTGFWSRIQPDQTRFSSLPTAPVAGLAAAGAVPPAAGAAVAASAGLVAGGVADVDVAAPHAVASGVAISPTASPVSRLRRVMRARDRLAMLLTPSTVPCRPILSVALAFADSSVRLADVALGSSTTPSIVEAAQPRRAPAVGPLAAARRGGGRRDRRAVERVAVRVQHRPTDRPGDRRSHLPVPPAEGRAARGQADDRVDLRNR